MNDTQILATKTWIETVVIGLNLCPFARRPFDGGTIRYAVSEATDTHALIIDFTRELRLLVETPIAEVETTLLIHPYVLQDFADYNDFLSVADDAIEQLQLRGIVQVASFHPQYQFAGTVPNAMENYTNRSPYPMLHMLREESISRVANDRAFLDSIPERNIATMQALDRNAFLKLWQSIAKPPPEST